MSTPRISVNVRNEPSGRTYRVETQPTQQGWETTIRRKRLIGVGNVEFVMHPVNPGLIDSLPQAQRDLALRATPERMHDYIADMARGVHPDQWLMDWTQVVAIRRNRATYSEIQWLDGYVTGVQKEVQEEEQAAKNLQLDTSAQGKRQLSPDDQFLLAQDIELFLRFVLVRQDRAFKKLWKSWSEPTQQAFIAHCVDVVTGDPRRLTDEERAFKEMYERHRQALRR